MNTLIFMASPHNNGNTSFLLNSFLKGIEGDYHIVNCYDEKIAPCIDCRYCYTHKLQCAIKDNMQEIYKKINSSDVVVLASPMYFMSFPGSMKNIIDRLQIYWSYKYIFKEIIKQDKTGVLLITAGSKWENMFNSIEEIGDMFFKTVGAQLNYKLYINDTDKFPVCENEVIQKKAYDIARKIATKK